MLVKGANGGFRITGHSWGDWSLISSNAYIFYFLPEVNFDLRVLSLPASVRVSVCVYQSLACPRDNSEPVQARILKYEPNMQKSLVTVSIVIWGAIDLDLQSQI